MVVASRPILAALLAGCAAMLSPAPAAAGEKPLALHPQPDIRKGIAAFPRPEGSSPAAQRIGKALEAADRRVRAQATDCIASGAGSPSHEPGTWTRAIAVTMNGPLYLSYLVQDTFFCGGAHPDNGAFPLVYDLQTGAPVNWAKLLPPALLGKASLDSGADGTRLGIVRSSALLRLYRAAYPTSAQGDLDADGVKECASALGDDTSFLLWPDARQHALMIQPNGLPHVIAACALSIPLTVNTLRAQGVGPALLDALEHARP